MAVYSVAVTQIVLALPSVAVKVKIGVLSNTRRQGGDFQLLP